MSRWNVHSSGVGRVCGSTSMDKSSFFVSSPFACKRNVLVYTPGDASEGMSKLSHTGRVVPAAMSKHPTLSSASAARDTGNASGSRWPQPGAKTSVSTYRTNRAVPIELSRVEPSSAVKGENSNSIWSMGWPDHKTSCADRRSPRQPLPCHPVEGGRWGMADLAYRLSTVPNAQLRPLTADQSADVVSGSAASAYVSQELTGRD